MSEYVDTAEADCAMEELEAIRGRLEYMAREARQLSIIDRKHGWVYGDVARILRLILDAPIRGAEPLRLVPIPDALPAVHSAHD